MRPARSSRYAIEQSGPRRARFWFESSRILRVLLVRAACLLARRETLFFFSVMPNRTASPSNCSRLLAHPTLATPHRGQNDLPTENLTAGSEGAGCTLPQISIRRVKPVPSPLLSRSPFNREKKREQLSPLTRLADRTKRPRQRRYRENLCRITHHRRDFSTPPRTR